MEIYQIVETDPTEFSNDEVVCYFLTLEDAIEVCEDNPNYYYRELYVYEDYSEYQQDFH
jgi:hypothetical protein